MTTVTLWSAPHGATFFSMSKKVRILRTSVTNPWFNLATEDWIFRDLDPETHVLYLWRNDNTVVIGAHQNPWAECKVEEMERDGVVLARRQSGGGAVFQDLGNTCFTFMSSRSNYLQDTNFQIVCNALAKLGIEAEPSGRNDIIVDGRKISGSAFRHTQDRSFHHGTLLVNTDMTRLGNYLTPHKLKLASKGVKSVKSRVANLVEFAPDLDNEKLCAALIEAFCEYHGETAEVEWLDEDTLRQVEELNSYYEKLADWDWRFGKTPEFSHRVETRFDWGIIDIHLNVEGATITEVKVYSDGLDAGFVPLLEQSLTGVKYKTEEIKAVLAGVAGADGERAQRLKDVSELLVSQYQS